MAWNNIENKSSGDLISADDPNALMENIRILAGNGSLEPTSSIQELSSVKAEKRGFIFVAEQDYTVSGSASDKYINIDAGSVDRTISLPSPGQYFGCELAISKTDSGAGKVVINGASSIDLESQGERIKFVSDGANWNQSSYYFHSRVYSGGSTYNGLTLTVSGDSGYSDIFSKFVPYRLSDGTWRLKFNMRGNYSTQVGPAHLEVTVNSVITSAQYQAIAVSGEADATKDAVASWRFSSGRILICLFEQVDSVLLSGDIELCEKPGWAL